MFYVSKQTKDDALTPLPDASAKHACLAAWTQNRVKSIAVVDTDRATAAPTRTQPGSYLARPQTMGPGLLEQLAVADTWGVVLVAGVCGALGSLAHRSTDDEITPVWWKSGMIGVIAAIGASALMTPSTAFELVGMAMLAGFFARTVLAALESRLALELAKRQAERAMTLASDAIELSRRTRANAPASNAADPDVGRLSARLDEVKAFRVTKQ